MSGRLFEPEPGGQRPEPEPDIPRQAGVRLHHGVRLLGRLVDRIDLHGCGRERLVEIAKLAVGRCAGRPFAGVVGRAACRFENEGAVGLLIGDDDRRSGGARLFRFVAQSWVEGLVDKPERRLRVTFDSSVSFAPQTCRT